MRISLICTALMLSLTVFGQKSLSKPGRVEKPLPMTLMEFYASDSTSFVYNSFNRMNMYFYCNADENGKVPGFNAQQASLLSLAGFLSSGEGSPAYMFLDEKVNDATFAGFKDLGLKQIPDILAKYSKFAKANADALGEGNEDVMTKAWYYDSLLYDVMTQSSDLNTLYGLFRGNNYFIRQDGQMFEPNYTGTVSVKNMKGKRLEELTVANGMPTGSSFTANFQGLPQSEISANGNIYISKYFDTNGKLISLDSSNTDNGNSFSKVYFPNGSLNAEYANSYSAPEGEEPSGMSIEKQYFSNGKLACEIHTDYNGNSQIVSAFDQKGKPSVKKGTGKVYRESIIPETNSIVLNITEYVSNVQTGLNETYTNGVLTNSFMQKNGLMSGSQKQFHWKNGKLMNETKYDGEGNYISDESFFDQNAPKIESSKVKVSMTVEPDQSCSHFGIWDPKFAVATVKNEKEVLAALKKQYNLLHYNADDKMPSDPSTYKYLVLDISEAGKPINTMDYTDKDLDLLNLFQFSPATYQGKPIKSRINVNIVTQW